MTGPDPALGPAEVVLAQLAAFQREAADGGTGEGLALAFSYASPGNQAAVGPLPVFGRMLRADAYRGLLGHRAASLGPVVQDGTDVQVEVLVLTADDETHGFTWVLSRQSAEPHAGCWMTDGVVRHPERRP